ncbi:hypothetical protein E4U37_008030 [Claviceps purpurea]|nr:hypothetical protein E4U37_008030 [Claviceps purpurea]
MTGAHLRKGQSGPPTAESTDSYWHKDPSAVLLGHRTTDDLPPAADVVVIGTGITGAFAARELVAGRRSVVHVEAREACWGATGRNGGHCQPLLYKAKPTIGRFELGTYTFLRDLVATNEIPCDWRTEGGVVAFYEDEVVKGVEEVIARLKREAPDLAEMVTLFEDKQDLQRLRVPWARAAVYQPNAAKVWPYKLVAWVLETLLCEYPAERYNLQTNTPVEHLQCADGGWIVHTCRGQIVARDVLLACNGYTSYLLPKMTGVVTPTRGQVAGLIPPEDHIPLEHTHGWLQGTSDDYMIQRDEDDDGTLILGGERLAAPGAEEGVWDDSEVQPAVAEKLKHALHGRVKLRAPGQEEKKKLCAEYEWTGIMGYSKDRHPWVGRVPAAFGGKPDDGLENEEGHLWMSVGYTGHGMPSAARCGMSAANMMLGKSEMYGLPAEYVATEERAEKVLKEVTKATEADTAMNVGRRHHLMLDLKAALLD